MKFLREDCNVYLINEVETHSIVIDPGSTVFELSNL